ncbi:MAG: hypothetical protein JO247_18785 [Chloroflexi bacterium]|nr:hypothetical protein [Chloroflexota bacterium]
MPLLLTQDDLRPLVLDHDLFEGAFKAIEDAVLRQHGGQGGQVAFVRLELAQGRILADYATSSANGVGIRLFPDAGSASGARNEHVMLLFDQSSGELQAILASDDLNPLRTAVPAGVGARYLAPAGAETLCILGTGQQGRAHLRTITHGVPSIRRALVWSPTEAHRQAFARESTTATGLDVQAVGSARDAVDGADVVTATGLLPQGQRAFETEWLKPGSLAITMTGGLVPPPGARSFVPTSNAPALLASPFGRPGGGPPGAGGPPGGGGPPLEDRPPLELAEVMTGRLEARDRTGQIAIYNLARPYGWDTPIMNWAYDWARKNGVGAELRLTSEQPALFPSW